MFKRIVIFLLVLSPLWYSLFVGYPVLSQEEQQAKEKKYPTISISRRCFDVGNFGQFLDCFSRSEKINGLLLVNSVVEKTNQISVILTIILLTSIIVFVTVSIKILS